MVHANTCAIVQVDDSQLEGLRAHFTQFDVDNSGYIDSHELTGVLRSMGFNPTDKRVAEVLSAYDTDRNGNLSFGEFVEVLSHSYPCILTVGPVHYCGHGVLCQVPHCPRQVFS